LRDSLLVIPLLYSHLLHIGEVAGLDAVVVNTTAQGSCIERNQVCACILRSVHQSLNELSVDIIYRETNLHGLWKREPDVGCF